MSRQLGQIRKIFSLENQMDILMGYDNPRNTHMPGHDVGAILKELGTYFKEATILESWLISLSHMQVDVCFLRGSSGLARFRKKHYFLQPGLARAKTLLLVPYQSQATWHC